eukprot:9309683-Lingulodinium_polyedra.AAC.1
MLRRQPRSGQVLRRLRQAHRAAPPQHPGRAPVPGCVRRQSALLVGSPAPLQQGRRRGGRGRLHRSRGCTGGRPRGSVRVRRVGRCVGRTARGSQCVLERAMASSCR